MPIISEPYRAPPSHTEQTDKLRARTGARGSAMQRPTNAERAAVHFAAAPRRTGRAVEERATADILQVASGGRRRSCRKR